LADNGPEFKNLYELEKDEEGKQICKVFYCDPYRSCQKAECEKNHGLFRRIWPKGRSLDILDRSKIDEIFSHINSYPRASLNDKSPYDLFSLEYKSIILTRLGILKIEVKDLKMKDYKTWEHKK
ncbi:MAG: IS30 family transposase, partial [Erysipelotrichaceae bacterium]|nr:IS30 family transposase [Erysipelotrichaceae bacterium]